MDSSDEEDLQKLRDSVDTTFFNDEMFKSSDLKKDKVVNLKSNRHLSSEEKFCDIRVNSDMQTRIGDKISKIIENKITFIDAAHVKQVEESDEIDGGIKLFSDSTDYLSHEVQYEPVIQKPRKKIKKRKIEDDEFNKKDSIKKAVISPDMILSHEETKHWKSRKRPKLYKYKREKNSRVLTSLD